MASDAVVRDCSHLFGPNLDLDGHAVDDRTAERVVLERRLSQSQKMESVGTLAGATADVTSSGVSSGAGSSGRGAGCGRGTSG